MSGDNSKYVEVDVGKDGGVKVTVYDPGCCKSEESGSDPEVEEPEARQSPDTGVWHWDHAVLTPSWEQSSNDPETGEPLVGASVLARLRLLETGVSAWEIRDLTTPDITSWGDQLQAALAAVPTDEERWVVVFWYGSVDITVDSKGKSQAHLKMTATAASSVTVELDVPDNVRLAVVYLGNNPWSYALFEEGGKGTQVVNHGLDGIDAAMDSLRKQVLSVRSTEAAAKGSGAQIDPEEVSLTDTSGSNATEPYTLTLRSIAGNTRIGDFVTYIDSASTPGPVQGFTAKQEYWKWSTTPWPNKFKLSPVGANPDVTYTAAAAWLVHSEGKLKDPGSSSTPTPTQGTDWRWYSIKGSTAVIQGYLGVHFDGNNEPDAMEWFGKKTALSDGRFSVDGVLRFFKLTAAPTATDVNKFWYFKPGSVNQQP